MRALVQHRFQVNDVRYDQEAFAFFVQTDPRRVETEFDDLRREMLDGGYIPMLLKERGGLIVYVTRMPQRRFRGIRVNIALLIATIATTIFAGMTFVSSYDDIGLFTLETVGKGALYFAAPLMLILGIHEMGHFIMARRYRVAASLPFFLPAPPILGTFGAAISLREPIPSKRALIDIGVAGPIAGFVVAIFITALGLQLSAWDPHPTGDDASVYVVLGTPLVYELMAMLVPTPEDVLIHPTAFAGWVGFLVTFLNLLPAGQLDGGHISRALFGDKARWVGYATIAGMLFVSFATGYWGWIFFLLLIVFFISLSHPPPLNDVTPLPPSRFMVGAVAFIMLAICFVPVPLAPSPLNPAMDAHFEPPDINVAPDGWANTTLVFNNTGNTKFDVVLRIQDDHGWNVTFDKRLKWNSRAGEGTILVRKSGDGPDFITRLNVTVQPPEGSELGTRETFTIEMKYNDNDIVERAFAKFTATVGWVSSRDEPQPRSVGVDTVSRIPLRFKNHIHDVDGVPTPFAIGLELPQGIQGVLTNTSVNISTPEALTEARPIGGQALTDNETLTVVLWLYAPPGTPVQNDLRANVLFEPMGHNITVVLGVLFDVVNPSYAVTIEPQYGNVTFVRGVQKVVAFDLRSYGSVNTTVRFTYTIDEANFTIVRKDDELDLPPGYYQTKSITIDPVGEIGSRSELRIEIAYGPDWKLSSSATIDLHITE